MRLSILTCALLGLAVPAAAQAPPHATLFGAWTGGLFPAPDHVTAQQCLAHPSVIITQDVVLRATLTDTGYVQRQIATVRGAGRELEFRFTPAEQPASSSGLLGGALVAPTPGFGCESPDVLHVQIKGRDQISFPGCADFPNPLVRCPAG